MPHGPWFNSLSVSVSGVGGGALSQISLRGQQCPSGPGAGKHPGAETAPAHLLPSQTAGQRGRRKPSETAYQTHPAGGKYTRFNVCCVASLTSGVNYIKNIYIYYSVKTFTLRWIIYKTCIYLLQQSPEILKQQHPWYWNIFQLFEEHLHNKCKCFFFFYLNIHFMGKSLRAHDRPTSMLFFLKLSPRRWKHATA